MKRIDKDINKTLYQRVSEPIRTKKDFVILLLETIRALFVDDIEVDSCGKMCIIVDKMSRVFYQIEDKIFSVVFPFLIERVGEEYKVYDLATDVEVDSKLVSIMLGIISQYKQEVTNMELLFDAYFDSLSEDVEGRDINVAWSILQRLFSIELGYIRYDYDVKRTDAEFHPINHVDINYSNNVTYKLGLDKRLELHHLVNLLDIKAKCNYIKL